MPLPSPSVPTFETTIPSNGKKVKYRPFLVKEEKVLLFVMESQPELPDQVRGVLFSDLPEETKKEFNDIYKKDLVKWEEEVTNVVKDILKACIISRIKLEDLANFDLEYLFLKIRAASVGEEIKLRVTCRDDGETQVTATINIDDVEVHKPEKHSNKIMLSDDLGLIMKYPGFKQFVNITLLNNSLDDTNELFDLIADCVDQIFQGDEVWDASDTKKSEIVDFIEGMTQKQFEKLQDFFTNLPRLYHDFTVTNPNTGVESTYRLEGLQSFFG